MDGPLNMAIYKKSIYIVGQKARVRRVALKDSRFSTGSMHHR